MFPLFIVEFKIRSSELNVDERGDRLMLLRFSGQTVEKIAQIEDVPDYVSDGPFPNVIELSLSISLPRAPFGTMTTLPPLPTAPFRANSLAQHIQDFTLVEPLDGSRGGPSTLTTVDNSKIRSWPYRTIRFKLNRDLPREFEERLRWLDLDGVIPVGQMSLGSNSRPDDEVYIVTESDVRRQLGEMMIHVNQVIRFCRSNQLVPLDTTLPRGYPIWRESEMASSGRPDAHLHDFHPSPRRYIRRQRMFEAKKCVHLRSIIKTVAKQADRSEGFTMTVREDGTTVLDPSFDEDVSSDNKLRIRMILNQVRTPVVSLCPFNPPPPLLLPQPSPRIPSGPTHPTHQTDP